MPLTCESAITSTSVEATANLGEIPALGVDGNRDTDDDVPARCKVTPRTGLGG